MEIPLQVKNGSRLRSCIVGGGILLFLIYFLLSWMWYKERMLQDDTPFYIIKLVQQQRLICEHNRFSSYLIQWIPLCFLKMNADLETITRIYSIAFSIYYLSIFLIAIYVLNNESGALFLLLFVCLSSARDFFLPVGEYLPAIITSTILFGINLSEDSRKLKVRFLTAVLLLGIIINFHLTGLLSAMFILLWNFFRSENKSRKYWIYLMAALIVISFLRLWILPYDEYESSKLGALRNFISYLIHPGQLTILTSALHFFQLHFIPLLFVFGLSILFLALQKKFVGIILLIAFEYFLFVLLGVIHGANAGFVLFGGYFLLLIIPPLMISIHFLLLRKNLFAISSVLLLSMITFIYSLFKEQAHFRKKTDYFNHIIEKGRSFPEHRYIILKSDVPSFIQNTWPIPFQTLLLSSLPHQDSSVTYIAGENLDIYNPFLYDSSSFLGPEWGPDMFNHGANKLPPRYFNLPHQGYRKLSLAASDF